MMIFKKKMPRRMFLYSAGAALGLPLLESMTPALARAGEQAAVPTRMTIVYVPNGVIMGKWTPAQEGSSFELTPILQPLANFREKFTVLSGLNNAVAWGIPLVEVAGEHPRASGSFLTGVHVYSGSKELRAGPSVDQIIADRFKSTTQIASLELGMESADILGTCDGGCSYSNTICWRNASTPLPMETQPRAVFERLFGASGSTSREEQIARVQKNRSILDYLSQDLARVQRTLGAGDRDRLNQYTEAIRDVERRIERAEAQSNQQLPTVQRPVGIPEKFSDHLKLMFDLLLLAYQSDLTRVGTVMVGHEMSNQTYPELGMTDPYHPYTHHQGDPEKISKAITVNTFHTTQLAYMLERMSSTKEGEGTLLDHGMTLYGAGLSDGNLHLPTNLPILLAGGKEFVRGGRHIRYKAGTPLTNFYLMLLDKLGIEMERFGDSNGKLEPLTV